MDIARLGFAVQTQPLDEANRKLYALAEAGDDAARGVEQAAGRISTATGNTAKGVSGLNAAVGDAVSGQNLKNFGFQMSQVAQQGMATGNYVQALAIQLPDLLMGFGTFGVLAGAAAGFLAPLVLNLFTGAEGAKRLKDAVDQLSDSFDGYKTAVELALSPTDDMEARFGSMADRMAPLLGQMATNKRIGLADEVRETVGELTGLLDEVSGVMSGLQAGEIAGELGLDRAFIAIGKDAKAARDQVDALALGVRDAMIELRNASGITEQFDAAAQLREAYAAAADANGERNSEEREYLDLLDQTLVKLAEIKAQDELLAAATDKRTGAVKGLAEATEEAAKNIATTDVELPDAGEMIQQATESAKAAMDGLNDELASKAEEAKQLLATAMVNAGTDPVALSQPFSDAMDQMIAKAAEAGQQIPANLNQAIAGMDAVAEAARAKGVLIGGNIGDGIVVSLQGKRAEVEAAARSMAQAAEAAVRAELDIQSPSRVMQELGGYVADGLAEGIETGKDRPINAMQDLARGISGVFQGMLFEGASFSKSMRSMLGNLFGNWGSSLFNSGLSGLGSIFGLPGFANGTRNAPGGLIRMHERGGEIAVLPSGSQVIPHDLSKQAVAQQTPVVELRMYVDQDGNWQSAVERISGKVSARMVAGSARQQQDRQYLRNGR